MMPGKPGKSERGEESTTLVRGHRWRGLSGQAESAEIPLHIPATGGIELVEDPAQAVVALMREIVVATNVATVPPAALNALGVAKQGELTGAYGPGLG